MKERALPLQQWEVLAILDGRTSQVRRPIKPQPRFAQWIDGTTTLCWKHCIYNPYKGDAEDQIVLKSPFGAPGDRLYVKETWRIAAWDPDYDTVRLQYKADGKSSDDFETDEANLFEKWYVQSTDDCLAAGLVADEDNWFQFENKDCPTRWRPSTHMHKWASRITLEVERVWCEQIQDISNEDAIAEGITQNVGAWTFEGSNKVWPIPAYCFAALWDSIYAAKGFGWDTNCWTFGCEFKVLEVTR